MELNTTSIFTYIKGALDNLIVAFALNDKKTKEAVLKDTVGPLLLEELRERGYPVISVDELTEFNESLEKDNLNKQVREIMETYYQTIKEIAGG